MPGETNFDIIKQEIVMAFGIATKDVAQQLLEFAQLEVPVGTAPVSGSGTARHPPGELRDSGRVEKIGPHSWEVVFDSPYAKKQHEAQQFEHPPWYSNSIQPGKAKYLEDPMKAMTAVMESEVGEILARTVRNRLGQFAKLGTPGASVAFRAEPWRGGGGLMR